MIEPKKLKELTNLYFTIDGIKHYLPLKDSKKKDKKGKSIYYGAMSDFTSEDFKTLSKNDLVKRVGKKDYTFKTTYDKADLLELNISAINSNICVLDIDGDTDQDIDFKNITNEKKTEWINQNIPEIFKNLPFTL
jgi:hypothetical protein